MALCDCGPVAPSSGLRRDVPPGWGELLAALGDLSGAIIAIAVLVLMAVGLIHGDLVPGYVYRREVKRGDDAEARLDARAAQDDAAAAAASVAERAAVAVASQIQRLQRAGNAADGSDEPT